MYLHHKVVEFLLGEMLILMVGPRVLATHAPVFDATPIITIADIHVGGGATRAQQVDHQFGGVDGGGPLQGYIERMAAHRSGLIWERDRVASSIQELRAPPLRATLHVKKPIDPSLSYICPDVRATLLYTFYCLQGATAIDPELVINLLNSPGTIADMCSDRNNRDSPEDGRVRDYYPWASHEEAQLAEKKLDDFMMKVPYMI